MTISSTTRKAGPFLGNGSATTFDFAYKVFDREDVVATLAVVATGAETALVLDTHYSVALNSDQNNDPGGTVTYPISGSAMASTHRLTLTSDIDELQSTDIQNAGGFYPEVIEDAIDRVTALVQQHREKLDRTLKAPVSETTLGDLPTAVDRAGLFLAFDGTGAPTTASGTGSDGALRTDLAASTAGKGALLVAFKDELSPAYLKTMSDIANGDPVSVFRFIAKTAHAAIQARTSAVDVSDNFEEALNILMDSDNSGGLYVPRGTYLHNESKTYGNTAGTIGQPIVIRGEGPYSIIRASGAGVIPITIAGPAPLTDVGRHIGRVIIERIAFAGPGGFAPGGTGTAIFLNGVQGVTLDKIYVNGWANAIKAQALDLCTLRDSWLQYNDYGFYNLEDAAAFSYPGGTLNSFRAIDNHILHNATSGVYIWGGTNHYVGRNNFAANGISINVASPLAINAVAVGTHIHHNYFENSTTNDVAIGGAGICRAGSIKHNTSLVANGVTALRLFNVSNAGGRGEVSNNQMSAISGSFTAISQAGSAETWDYNGATGSDYRPGSTLAFAKTGVLAGASVNIFKLATFGQTMRGTLTVTGSSTGIATSKTYQLNTMGGGNTIAVLTAVADTQNYAGGASTFTATDTVDTPVAGTNTISLNNTSAATCRFDCVLEIHELSGTLTLL